MTGLARTRLARTRLARTRLALGGRRVRTPTVLQMEAAECGAASLAMVLAYYGRFVPLEELRNVCGVSRDGSKASNVLKAGQRFGMVGRGFKKEPAQLAELKFPLILFWNFNHFVVLEGVTDKIAFLNDPALGRRKVEMAEFTESFTGVCLALEPGQDFRRGGERASALRGLAQRLGHSRWALIYIVTAGLALVIPGLLTAVFTRTFVDYVLIQRLSAWLGPLLLAMVAAAAVRGALTWIQQQALVRTHLSFSLAGASQFFWHVLRLPAEYFAQRYGVEIAGRNALNERVAGLLSGELAAAALSLIAVSLYAVIMAQYDATLTAVGVVFAVFNLLCVWRASVFIRDLSRRLQIDQGKLGAITVRGFSMLESLKSTGSENMFLSRWAGYYAKVLNAEQSFGRVQVLLSGLPVVLMGFSDVAIITLGGLRVMSGAITIGVLIGFRALMVLFTQPIAHLSTLGAQIQEVGVDIERLDDVLKNAADPSFTAALAPTPARPSAARTPAKPTAKLTGSLRVKDLRYGYGALSPPLIDGFSLDLEPGARIALVGGSGSGKSTIGKLLCGLYTAWDGDIELGGLRLQDTPRGLLRHTIGYVDQNIALFSGTVRDNINLWDATLGEGRLIEAAQDASIHDEIMLRRNGYDHLVEEGGRNFSGGQRQRIILARALAQSPSVLILDEATSALDAATEFEFMETLRHRGISAIIIAHRLSTIRDCDEIILLNRGEIVERGRHESLMSRDGLYHRLVEA